MVEASEVDYVFDDAIVLAEKAESEIDAGEHEDVSERIKSDSVNTGGVGGDEAKQHERKLGDRSAGEEGAQVCLKNGDDSREDKDKEGCDFCDVEPGVLRRSEYGEEQPQE